MMVACGTASSALFPAAVLFRPVHFDSISGGNSRHVFGFLFDGFDSRAFCALRAASCEGERSSLPDPCACCLYWREWRCSIWPS